MTLTTPLIDKDTLSVYLTIPCFISFLSSFYQFCVSVAIFYFISGKNKEKK